MSKRKNKNLIKKYKNFTDINFFNLDINPYAVNIRDTNKFKKVNRNSLYEISCELNVIDNFHDFNNIFNDITLQNNLDVLNDGFIDEFNPQTNFFNNTAEDIIIDVIHYKEFGNITLTLNIDKTIDISNELSFNKVGTKNLIFNDQLNDPREIINKNNYFIDQFVLEFNDNNFSIENRNSNIIKNKFIYSSGYTYKNSDYTNNIDSIVFGGKTY